MLFRSHYHTHVYLEYLVEIGNHQEGSEVRGMNELNGYDQYLRCYENHEVKSALRAAIENKHNKQ